MEVARVLLERDVDANARDASNATPLHLAAISGPRPLMLKFHCCCSSTALMFMHRMMRVRPLARYDHNLRNPGCRGCPWPSARVCINRGSAGTPRSRQVMPVRLDSLQVTESRGLTMSDVPQPPAPPLHEFAPLGSLRITIHNRVPQIPFCLMTASSSPCSCIDHQTCFLHAPFIKSVNGSLGSLSRLTRGKRV